MNLYQVKQKLEDLKDLVKSMKSDYTKYVHIFKFSDTFLKESYGVSFDDYNILRRLVYSHYRELTHLTNRIVSELNILQRHIYDRELIEENCEYDEVMSQTPDPVDAEEESMETHQGVPDHAELTDNPHPDETIPEPETESTRETNYIEIESLEPVTIRQ